MIEIRDLKKIDFLSELSDEELQPLVAGARRFDASPGDVILQEGQKAKELFFLEDGRVAIEIDVGLGRKTSVYTVTPGEPFVWSALVPPHSLTASLRAVEPSTILAVQGDALREQFDQHPKVARLVLEQTAKIISTRLKDTRLQLINMLHWPTKDQTTEV